MCQFDDAQKLEESDRRKALALQRLKMDFSQPSKTHCIDCGQPIPETRQAIGGVKRCIDCQTNLEKA